MSLPVLEFKFLCLADSSFLPMLTITEAHTGVSISRNPLVIMMKKGPVICTGQVASKRINYYYVKPL